MLIRRLDVFFRTQLVLQDTSNRCNSATNIAFAAIQHLIGQKRYECLKGRVTEKAPDPTLPTPYYKTLLKIVIWIGAFCLVPFLTPIGIATRYLSFRSPEIEQVYSLALILQVPQHARTSSMFAFLFKKPEAERHAFLKELPLDIKSSFLSLNNPQDAHAFLLYLSKPECTQLLMELPEDLQISFLSQKEQHDYALQFLLQLPGLQGAQLSMQLPASVQNNYVELQEVELKKAQKKKIFNDQLNAAITFLSQLAEKKDKSSIESLFKEASNGPFYPYPFLLAEKLQTTPALGDLADPALMTRLGEVHTKCCQHLEALGFTDHRQEEAQQKKIQADSISIFKSVFTANNKFFSELMKVLQTPATQSTEIMEWLNKQKKSSTYSYPFKTHPQVLELMGKIIDPLKIQPLVHVYSACIAALKEKELTIEEEIPTLDHPLIGAMDRLENISNFQSLIKA